LVLPLIRRKAETEPKPTVKRGPGIDLIYVES
jgi:hypothetical protein